jgi:hypothetical protein
MPAIAAIGGVDATSLGKVCCELEKIKAALEWWNAASNE